MSLHLSLLSLDLIVGNGEEQVSVKQSALAMWGECIAETID